MHFGIGKVNEECGELQETVGLTIMLRATGRLTQLIGKAIPFPVGDHPDGAGAIRERMIEEMADVRAAIYYYGITNLSEYEQHRIAERVSEKVLKFQEWGLTGIPAQPVEKA